MLRQYTLFSPGEDPEASMRIPELLVTQHGTLLAFCENRHKKGDFDPMALVARRRETDGAWSKKHVIQEELSGAWVGNPVAFNAGGHVHLVFCKSNKRLFITTSRDDGVTFEKEREITAALDAYKGVWNPVMIGSGPGGACVARSGRVFIPLWIGNGTRVNPDGSTCSHLPQKVACVYSDDEGETWSAGDLVENMTDDKGLGEAQMIELPRGFLLSIRNDEPERRRAFAFSVDGVHWEAPSLHPEIKECYCQASLKRFGDIVLASHPDCDFARMRMAIRVSSDYGKTFGPPALLNAGVSGYSALEQLRDGTFVCMYETYVVREGFWGGVQLVVAEFDMDFLLTGAI